MKRAGAGRLEASAVLCSVLALALRVLSAGAFVVLVMFVL